MTFEARVESKVMDNEDVKHDRRYNMLSGRKAATSELTYFLICVRNLHVVRGIALC